MWTREVPLSAAARIPSFVINKSNLYCVLQITVIVFSEDMLLARSRANGISTEANSNSKQAERMNGLEAVQLPEP